MDWEFACQRGDLVKVLGSTQSDLDTSCAALNGRTGDGTHCLKRGGAEPESEPRLYMLAVSRSEDEVSREALVDPSRGCHGVEVGHNVVIAHGMAGRGAPDVWTDPAGRLTAEEVAHDVGAGQRDRARCTLPFLLNERPNVNVSREEWLTAEVGAMAPLENLAPRRKAGSESLSRP